MFHNRPQPRASSLSIKRHLKQAGLRYLAMTVVLAVFAIAGLYPVLKSLFTPSYAADPPSVISVSPSSGVVSGGANVTITGSQFSNQIPFTSIDAGVDHTCGILDGKAYCWGDNTYGQLGDGTTTSSHKPVAVNTSGVLSGKTVTAISVGAGYSCALAAGQAYCWGHNDGGQLGDGTTTDRHTPVAVDTSGVLNGKTVTAISASGAVYYPFSLPPHTCVVANSRAYCWGDNSGGQLGDGTATSSPSPIAVSTSSGLGTKAVTAISVGIEHSCVIADSQVYCWGYNSTGQLGDGTISQRNSPVKVNGQSASTTATLLAAGGVNTCAVVNGSLYCWGSSGSGQLDSASSVKSPKLISGFTGKTISSIDIAGDFSALFTLYGYICAVADGNAYCWGYNSNGQVGDGTTTNRSTPIQVSTGGTTTMITAGGNADSSAATYHSCAITDGTVDCWGSNAAGQLGDNSTTERHTPTSLYTAQLTTTRTPTVLFGTTPATNVNYVSATELTATTPAHAAGPVDVTVTNADGQNDTQANAFTYTPPLAITNVSPDSGSHTGGTSVTITGTHFTLTKVKQIANGLDTTSCALAMNHDVYCWGDNTDYGQIGNGTSTGHSATPTKIKMDGALSGKTITDLSSGFHYSCVVASGKPYCWGDNSGGQLGDGGAEAYSNQPVAVTTSGVLAGKTVTKIATGYYHSCVIADGKAYCWGDNSHGGLGNNSTTASSVPVAVDTSGALNGKTVTDISIGQYYTCAVADGKVYCWGYGQYSRLGIGSSDNTDKLTPIAVDDSGVLAGKTVTHVSLGESHSCVLADSQVYCWGNNWAGQVGNNSTSQAGRPVAVDTSGALNGKTITALQAGPYQTCVIANNREYCWGYNNEGQLGDGTTTDRHTPVAIATSGAMQGKPVTALGGGSQAYSCSIADDTIYCWGANWDGNLGNGTDTNSSVPVAATMTAFTAAPPDVYFDSTPATNVNYVSATELTATTPAHAIGTVDVRLVNASQQTATLPNGYEYLADPPTAPTDLTTSPADMGVALTWQAPSNDGGAAITTYQVEYSSNGGSSWQSFAHPASTATAITVTGLSPGITYQFRVSAVNAIGTSPPSNQASGTPIYITLDSSGAVTIGVVPNGTSTVSSSQHTLVVNTNDPTGYSITLEMAGASRNLVNGSQNISPTSGSLASPGSLTINTWGFRVDGVGGFGAGPTVQETNVTTSGYSWAGVPASDNPVTIQSSAAPASNAQTTVWFALNASNTKPSGDYTATLLYTAVAN